MKFQRKPLLINAVQWTGLATDIGKIDKELISMDGPSCKKWEFEVDSGNLYIPTLEGVMCARPGDWIIKGVEGEFYPCKPNIFEKTYTPIENYNTNLCMDINTPPGAKVVFTFPNAGHDWQQQRIKELGIQIGDIFTVKSVSVHSWHTDVCLEEFCDEIFNSVMFKNAVKI